MGVVRVVADPVFVSVTVKVAVSPTLIVRLEKVTADVPIPVGVVSSKDAAEMVTPPTVIGAETVACHAA
jgi:hypothetical protein